MSESICIGICISPDRLPDLAPGYDYVELGVSSALKPLEDDAAFQPELEKLSALSLPVRAFNLFVPSQVRLTGPDVDWDQVRLYVDRAAKRVEALGGETIVFGSGGARRVPEGYSRAKAWGQLVRFCNHVADSLQDTDITLAIEPLNSNESNILNTYSESVQLARDVDRDKIRVLADIYHFVVEEEPLDDIAEGAEWLEHVHLADSGRRNPGSGAYPLKRWFDILHDINYTGKASVECRWGEDFTKETADSLAFLRDLVG